MGLPDILYARMTKKDLEELEAIVTTEVNKIQKPFRVKYEIAFHGKLYQMTGNDTFTRFQRILLPVFEYVVSEEEKASGVAKVGKVTHRQLLEILKKGGPEEFRQAMKAHLKPHFDKLSEKN
jgi:DNA-binding FadR family transcriptional regulator